MRLGLQVAGLAAVLVGLLWLVQGLGLVHWPARSFMLDQRPWAVRGALVAAVGAVLLWRARGR